MARVAVFLAAALVTGCAAQQQPMATATATAMATPTPETQPVTVVTVDPVPTPPAPSASGTVVYLASYRSAHAAEAGWAVLAKASPILARQRPITMTVDLGRKGTWVRLYGMAADEAERSRLCSQLARRIDECGSRNRE
jgi:hypothetical protein